MLFGKVLFDGVDQAQPCQAPARPLPVPKGSRSGPTQVPHHKPPARGGIPPVIRAVLKSFAAQTTLNNLNNAKLKRLEAHGSSDLCPRCWDGESKTLHPSIPVSLPNEPVPATVAVAAAQPRGSWAFWSTASSLSTSRGMPRARPQTWHRVNV